MVPYAHIQWGRTSFIKLIWGLRPINVLAKFENNLWKIADLRVLIWLVCLAAQTPTYPPDQPAACSGVDNTPEPLRAGG